MKTTVELPDELVREVKALAGESGVTMRELIVDGLQRELERRRSGTTARPDFVFPTVSGRGLAPGLEGTDLSKLAYDDAVDLDRG